MLDKKDLQAFGKMLDDRLGLTEKKFDEKLKDGFIQFWETLVLPYFDRNEKHHQEIKEKIESMDKTMERMGDNLYEIKDYIKDHEKRIRTLEKAAVTS